MESDQCPSNLVKTVSHHRPFLPVTTFILRYHCILTVNPFLLVAGNRQRYHPQAMATTSRSPYYLIYLLFIILENSAQNKRSIYLNT